MFFVVFTFFLQFAGNQQAVLLFLRIKFLIVLYEAKMNYIIVLLR
jgi:hypothetical protein